MSEPVKIPYKLGITYGANKVMITIKFHNGSAHSVNHRHDGIGVVTAEHLCDKWENEYIEFHLAHEGPFEHTCRNGYRLILNRQNGTLMVKPPESTS